MTPENFCYWLQGYFEIGTESSLTEQQVNEIKSRLKLVCQTAATYITINCNEGAEIPKEVLAKLRTYRTQLKSTSLS